MDGMTTANNILYNLKSPTASMFGRHDKRAKSIALNPINPGSDRKMFLRVKGGSPGAMYESVDDPMAQMGSSVIDFIKKN